MNRRLAPVQRGPRPTICGYCGVHVPKTARDKEHVIPRNLYPEGFGPKLQRLIIPACRACNASWTEDEVHFRNISDNSIGLYGYNVAPNVPALYAENLAANPANRFAAQFNGDVWVYGNFVVVGGGKYAAVTMPDGTEALVYCQESPEPYFEDFGRARLVNGVAHVQLEPEFASIVKRDDYMVFPDARRRSSVTSTSVSRTPTALKFAKPKAARATSPSPTASWPSARTSKASA